jgi:hypothetical protein
VEALRERAAADALRSVPLDAYAAFLFLCGCAARELSLLKTSMLVAGAHARAPRHDSARALLPLLTLLTGLFNV